MIQENTDPYSASDDWELKGVILVSILLPMGKQNCHLELSSWKDVGWIPINKDFISFCFLYGFRLFNNFQKIHSPIRRRLIFMLFLGLPSFVWYHCVMSNTFLNISGIFEELSLTICLVNFQQDHKIGKPQKIRNFVEPTNGSVSKKHTLNLRRNVNVMWKLWSEVCCLINDNPFRCSPYYIQNLHFPRTAVVKSIGSGWVHIKGLFVELWAGFYLPL